MGLRLRCRAHTAVKSDEDDVLNDSDMKQGIMGTVTAGPTASMDGWMIEERSDRKRSDRSLEHRDDLGASSRVDRLY